MAAGTAPARSLKIQVEATPVARQTEGTFEALVTEQGFRTPSDEVTIMAKMTSNGYIVVHSHCSVYKGREGLLHSQTPVIPVKLTREQQSFVEAELGKKIR